MQSWTLADGINADNIFKCDDGVKGAPAAAGTVRHRREGRVAGRRIGRSGGKGGMAWAEGERDRIVYSFLK